ncbi:hypothetical protein AA0113_g12246 [Alternaria arborescens]|uniref:Major facilitator superfamily (MFS) profile domain-containing protein n=1 Tax=Alternaria arborescens TaxID=156630 RepID=A0A4Q4PXN5_9PLEO|nr:hypothetical protein AA0113_g12246 [Alternaria arborescens]
MARSMPMPSSKEQRHGREREQSGEHDRQHNHKHACWPRWSLSHQADDYELRQFVKELENSFGCNRPAGDARGTMPPCKPERAYTKSSVSTSGSTTHLLKLDAETAVAEAVEDEPDDRTDWKPERKQWLAMISLSLISFVVSLDATILVTALPEISHSLRGSAAETFWTGTTYLLISAVFQPVIAAASACCGRQRLLIMSIVLFTFGTAFCAVAHDFAVMLIGRCVQGVGGGGVIALTQVIFCDMVPLRQRPQYFSMVLASWSIGSIIGPVLGGAFVESASWRWCFYINFPFCFLGFSAALLFVDDVDVPLADHPRRMDWLGAFLFVGSTTSLLLGISWGATVAPVVAGVLGIAGFVAWQWRAQPHSLLPVSLLQSASSAAAFFCALVNGLVLFTGLYYVPFYQMSVRGSSPVRAGIDLFPAVCLLVPGSVVVAILTSRLGHFRWAIWLGWSVTLVACGMFTVFDERTEKAIFALALAVFGVGNGMVLTSVNVATQAIANQTVAKKEDRAMAACMYGFMRSLGMPVGVALSGTVFQNAMGSALSDAGLPTDIARDSERYIFILHSMADVDPRKSALLGSYSRGFHAVFVAMAVLSAAALLASLSIRRCSMDTVRLAGPQRNRVDSEWDSAAQPPRNPTIAAALQKDPHNTNRDTHQAADPCAERANLEIIAILLSPTTPRQSSPCHTPCLFRSQTAPRSIGSYAGLVESQESRPVHQGSENHGDVHEVVADIWQAEVHTDRFVENQRSQGMAATTPKATCALSRSFRHVDAQPEASVNVIGEDVVQGRAGEAQSRSREVERNTYCIAGERTLVNKGEAHDAGTEPERAE